LREEWIATAKALAKIALAIAVVVIGAAGWVMYDIAQLRKLCDAATAGEALSETKARAMKFGVNEKRFDRTVKDSATGHFVVLIAAEKTLGEFVCFIRHDGQRVISSKMEGP
jgi:hypothetical protein